MINITYNTYAGWLALSEHYSKMNALMGDALNEAIPEEFKGCILPDHIRTDPTYRELKRNYDESFTTLRNFNKHSPKEYMKKASVDRRNLEKKQ